MIEEPLKVGSIELSNRLVMPPMATEKSSDGRVTSALVDYYAKMTATHKIGLVITEHAYVSPEGKASKGQVSIADDEAIEGLARLTEVIHVSGSAAIAQLAHAGSAADRSLTGLEPISASAIPNMRGMTKGSAGGKDFKTIGSLAGEGDTEPARACSQADIDTLVDKFTRAATRAKEAGYDGCEIHSAHGYLLNQFYSPLTNFREDEYGGSIEKRIRIHLRIIEAIRMAAGRDFLISLRLGACDYGEGGTTIKDSVTAVRAFEAAGLDMVSVSGGMCDYVNPTSSEQGWFSDASSAISEACSIPVLLTGGITTPEAADELLARGACDLVGVGRALLKDPSWPDRAL